MMFLLACIAAYLIGCIPTAYLVMRKMRGIDIREHGTGNVGAMNTYDVSGSKFLGIVTMLLDALKGAVAVWLAYYLQGGWFPATGMAAFLVIVGHNFNIFLRGKGGRGLATATGAFIAINPLAVILWDVMYLTGYFAIRRNVHIASMTAIIGVAVLIWSTPGGVIDLLMFLGPTDPMSYRLTVLVCCIPLFLRHIAPVREALASELA